MAALAGERRCAERRGRREHLCWRVWKGSVERASFCQQRHTFQPSQQTCTTGDKRFAGLSFKGSYILQPKMGSCLYSHIPFLQQRRPPGGHPFRFSVRRPPTLGGSPFLPYKPFTELAPHVRLLCEQCRYSFHQGVINRSTVPLLGPGFTCYME